MRLLRSRLPELSSADADRIAAAVGDLPLAVHQAAALVAETGLEVALYLQLLTNRTQELLDHHSRSRRYPVSVAASWSVAFDQLAYADSAALQLLTLVAWLAPEPVPLTLITHQHDLLPSPLAETAADPLVLAATTAALRRHVLARIELAPWRCIEFQPTCCDAVD